MIEKKAKTSEKIAPLLEKRWSPRSYNPNKKVSKEQLISIAEAGRWTASCANEQPWNIIFVNKHLDEGSHKKVYEALAVGNQKWCKNVPCFGVVIARNYFEKKETSNDWAGFDCGAATTSMMLQANELGLKTHPMAGFEEEEILKAFDIPTDHKVYAIFALGYQDEAEKLEEPFLTREKSERVRKELNENFFFAEWGKGIKE